MFLTCQASGPTNQHRKYIRAEYQFHCHTGPSVRAAMQSRPRWPASLIRCLLSLLYREKRETVWSGTGTTVYAWKPRASGKPAEEKKKTRKHPHRKLPEKNRMKRSEITMEENGADGGAQNWEPKWQRLKYLFRFPETEDRNVSHLPGKRPY